MAENKKSFILYADLLSVVKKLVLKDREDNTNYAGELFLHILEYVNDNEPVPINFIVDMAFEPIKISLKRDLKKYECYKAKQSLNGSKGGRPEEDRVSKSISNKEIPRHSNNHYVYLLLDEETNEVKIGETRNLYNRRQTVKRSSRNLIYIDFFEVKDTQEGLNIESEFKLEFKKWHTSGDWFEGIDVEKAIAFLKKRTVFQKAKKADSVSVSVNDINNNISNEKDHENTKPQPTVEETFNIFWDHYHNQTGKPKTDKNPAFKKWKKLTLNERRKAYTAVKTYSKSNPDSQYLKKARTYLEDKSFNDEAYDLKAEPSKEELLLWTRQHMNHDEALGEEPLRDSLNVPWSGMYYNRHTKNFQDKPYTE